MKSSFFTEIAQNYNVGIESVEFVRLEKRILGKVVATNQHEPYRIYIDREKAHCAFQIVFVLFHEIAHVKLSHFGDQFYLINNVLIDAREKEADHWALKELGVIDGMNQLTADNLSCHLCLITNSSMCLKHKT